MKHWHLLIHIDNYDKDKVMEKLKEITAKLENGNLSNHEFKEKEVNYAYWNLVQKTQKP